MDGQEVLLAGNIGCWKNVGHNMIQDEGKT